MRPILCMICWVMSSITWTVAPNTSPRGNGSCSGQPCSNKRIGLSSIQQSRMNIRMVIGALVEALTYWWEARDTNMHMCECEPMCELRLSCMHCAEFGDCICLGGCGWERTNSAENALFFWSQVSYLVKLLYLGIKPRASNQNDLQRLFVVHSTR